MGSFYLTCVLFVLVVLGTIAALTGFSILRFIAYIKDELLTVLGTSSSESALVPLMQKLERLGCSKSVVGLVVPSGYSFNLDGTNIYLTMAALFVAQALNIDLTLQQQLTHPGRGDADVEGRVGRDRRGLHHAGRDAGRRAVDPGGRTGADPGHRSLHVGGAVAHQLHRQRRGDDRGVAVGRRARSRGARARTGAAEVFDSDYARLRASKRSRAARIIGQFTCNHETRPRTGSISPLPSAVSWYLTRGGTSG